MDQFRETVSESWNPDIRIANPPPSLLTKYTRKEKDFFYDYATFVLKIVQDPTVTERLRLILEAENIRFSPPVDIRLMVFPARSFRGQSNRVLHGSYSSSASQISLYPLNIPRDWIRMEGFDLFKNSLASLSERKKRLLNEISENAIATLLHEIFHVKLGSRELPRYAEESIVKKMETEYMAEWTPIIVEAARRAVDGSQPHHSSKMW
jgi:hypothetical protein